MASTTLSHAPFCVVTGGDPYLNDQAVRDLRQQAQHARPDAELI